MEPQKPTKNQPSQDELLKEAQAAAAQASEATEQAEERHSSPNGESSFTSAPESEPTPQPATEPQPLVAPDSVVAPAKKKHTARNVILIILGILLLSAGGLAIWFFAYFNAPTKVVGDALQHLVTTENISANISVATQNSDTESLSADMDLLASRHLPMKASLRASVNSNETKRDFSADLSMDQEGTIYASTKGLPEILGVTKEVREIADFADESVRASINLFDEIDSETWRINIPEIIANLELEPEAETAFNQAFSCTIESIKDNGGNTADPIISAYQSHPFFNVQPATGNSFANNIYNLSVNSDQLTQFLGEVSNSSAASRLQQCMGGANKNITAPDTSTVESFVGELPTITVKINWLSHQFEKITLTNSDNSGTVEAKLSYPEKINIDTPTEYRSATELVDQITDVILLTTNSSLNASPATGQPAEY